MDITILLVIQGLRTQTCTLVEKLSWLITVIQVCDPTTNAKEVEQFYEDLHDLLELTPKKRCPFLHRGLK